MADKQEGSLPLKGGLVNLDRIRIWDSEEAVPTDSSKGIEYLVFLNQIQNALPSVSQGTFTPTLNFNAGDVASSSGYYYQIGRFVYVEIQVNLSANTNTSVLQIRTLPLQITASGSPGNNAAVSAAIIATDQTFPYYNGHSVSTLNSTQLQVIKGDGTQAVNQDYSSSGLRFSINYLTV